MIFKSKKQFQFYNWLIYALVNPQLKDIIKKYAHGILADIGCGTKPFYHLTKKYVNEHVGIDFDQSIHGNPNTDIIANAYKIPVQDNYFDFVLCSYVLEHLEEPQNAVKEANRILKKGKYALYTVPMFWHLHEEPRDFFRFTKYGLKHLFETNNFEIVEMIPVSGFWVTFFQEACYYLIKFRRGRYINPLWWLIPPITIIIQIIGFLLNKIDTSYEFTIEYIVVARKL